MNTYRTDYVPLHNNASRETFVKGKFNMSEIGDIRCGLRKERPMPDTFVRKDEQMSGGTSAFIMPTAGRRAAVNDQMSFVESKIKGGLMGDKLHGGVSAEQEEVHTSEPQILIDRAPFIHVAKSGDQMVNFHPTTVVQHTKPYQVNLTHLFEFEPAKAGSNMIKVVIPASDVRKAIDDAMRTNMPEMFIPGCSKMDTLVDGGKKTVVHGGNIHIDTNYEGPFGVEWFHAPHYNQKSVGGKAFLDVIGPDADPTRSPTVFDVSASTNSKLFSFLGGKSFTQTRQNEYKEKDGNIERDVVASRFDIGNDNRIFRLAGHLADPDKFVTYLNSADHKAGSVRVAHAYGKQVMGKYVETYEPLIPDARLEKGVRLIFHPLNIEPATVVPSDQSAAKVGKAKAGGSAAKADQIVKNTSTSATKWKTRTTSGDPMPDKCFGRVNMTLYITHLQTVPNNTRMTVPLGKA